MIKLYNDDCWNFLKTLPDNSVHLTILDPPYDVSVDHDGGKLYHNKGFDKSNAEIVDAGINNGYDIRLLGNELFRIMPYMNAYFFCNKKQIPEYFDYYVKEHKCNFEILFWNKGNALPTYNGKYLTDTEYCLYFYEGGHKLCNPSSYDDAKTFYSGVINSEDKKLWNHPTIKPLPFIEKMVRNSSQEGDTVLDCFMGSGTTGVACKLNNRNFIGCEINPEYYAICEERINGTSVRKVRNSLF